MYVISFFLCVFFGVFCCFASGLTLSSSSACYIYCQKLIYRPVTLIRKTYISSIIMAFYQGRLYN